MKAFCEEVLHLCGSFYGAKRKRLSNKMKVDGDWGRLNRIKAKSDIKEAHTIGMDDSHEIFVSISFLFIKTMTCLKSLISNLLLTHHFFNIFLLKRP